MFSGVNPQGCEVESFKAPSTLEQRHDFLWRHAIRLPKRGHIGIHNRSWYEEVLVARVHPGILESQPLPDAVRGPKIFEQRIEDIAAFERYLARQGTVILKFFLNLGRDEQRERFLARINEPDKNWKFEAGDARERRHWDDYMHAYEKAIRGTAAPHAPWYVVPADRKWLTRLVVAEAIVEALEALDLQYPTVSSAAREAMDSAHKELR